MALLSKPPQGVVIPGTPGVRGESARQQCTAPVPPGTATGDGVWQTKCRLVDFPVGSSLPVGAGQNYTVISVTSSYIRISLCASEWVPNG
jgi:hypothetical protein